MSDSILALLEPPETRVLWDALTNCTPANEAMVRANLGMRLFDNQEWATAVDIASPPLMRVRGIPVPEFVDALLTDIAWRATEYLTLRAIHNFVPSEQCSYFRRHNQEDYVALKKELASQVQSLPYIILLVVQELEEQGLVYTDTTKDPPALAITPAGHKLLNCPDTYYKDKN